MKRIPLVNYALVGSDPYAIVDDENYDDMMQFKWFAETHEDTFYAVRYYTVDGKVYKEYMHDRVVGIPREDQKKDLDLNENADDLSF
jgi:hypothetical protein